MYRHQCLLSLGKNKAMENIRVKLEANDGSVTDHSEYNIGEGNTFDEDLFSKQVIGKYKIAREGDGYISISVYSYVCYAWVKSYFTPTVAEGEEGKIKVVLDLILDSVIKDSKIFYLPKTNREDFIRYIENINDSMYNGRKSVVHLSYEMKVIVGDVGVYNSIIEYLTPTGKKRGIELGIDESPLLKQEGGNHYKNMVIQPMEYVHNNGIGYIEGTAIKYISRHRFKNGREDILKAIHTLEILLELEYFTPTGQDKK